MDILTATMSKEEDLMKRILDTYVSRNSFTDVRANMDGFEAPSALSNKESEDRIVPDITAVKRGAKWYIELVRKDGDTTRTVSKWKLLGTIAKARGGELVLICPSGSFAFAERLVKQHDIAAQIVKF